MREMEKTIREVSHEYNIDLNRPGRFLIRNTLGEDTPGNSTDLIISIWDNNQGYSFTGILVRHHSRHIISCICYSKNWEVLEVIKDFGIEGRPMGQRNDENTLVSSLNTLLIFKLLEEAKTDSRYTGRINVYPYE